MKLLPDGFYLGELCAEVFSEHVEGADDPIRGAGSGTWFAGNRAGKPAGFAMRFAMAAHWKRWRCLGTISFRRLWNLFDFRLTEHAEGSATLLSSQRPP